MPNEPLTFCSAPGCGTRVARGRCAKHAKRDLRASAARRGYDSEWRRLRAALLEARPYCMGWGPREIVLRDHRAHGNSAVEVDHITPLREGGTNDWGNLRQLCKRCHSRRTATENMR